MTATTTIKAAYYGTDTAGRPTVMVTKDYRSADNPGWSRSETMRFIHANTVEEAAALAASLKASGEVQIVRAL
jgi:hypothetical protein